jgi:hypothetical protein
MTQHTDPNSIPSGEAYRHVACFLSASLPPPPDDTPDALSVRDMAARAALDALQPANALEAMLAAQFVAACMQALDCLRLANLPDTAPAANLKCKAQAVSMMRQSQAALRALARMQDAREAQVALPAATKAPAKPKPVAAPSRPVGRVPELSASARLVDDLMKGLSAGSSTPLRLSPGKRDFETIVRQAASVRSAGSGASG